MALNRHLIPGFEIVERLASGGVAEVFRGIRAQDGIEVALKVTSLAELDPEFHAGDRFQREGALLSRLNHPALPELYGYGVTGGDLGWIALELVRGLPLSQLQGKPALDLLPVFIQVAEALSAVAQEGIIHRDISPDNILVEERHGRLRPRLIDFGIAKDLLAESGGPLTRHGAFLGKLSYASPEQLLGLPPGQTLDFRSDVFSLGMTMYELLSGRRAIPGEGLVEVAAAHRSGRIELLVVPQDRGGPAPRLEALVMRMIAPRREDRPGSWEEVLAGLWKSREELSPLTETLARKGAGRLSAVTTAASPPLPASASRAITRELLLGRAVLAFGVLAFLGSVAFAVHTLSATRQLTAARPSATPGLAGAAATAGGAQVATVPSVTPIATPVATRVPTSGAAPPPGSTVGAARPRTAPQQAPAVATPAQARAASPAVLEVSLTPEGELEELVDASGRNVAGRRPLPVRLELPPGRYRLRLVARSLDCTRTVSVTLRAGETVSVRESCIEIK